MRNRDKLLADEEWQDFVAYIRRLQSCEAHATEREYSNTRPPHSILIEIPASIKGKGYMAIKSGLLLFAFDCGGNERKNATSRAKEKYPTATGNPE
jgi:hypothetical protein